MDHKRDADLVRRLRTDESAFAELVSQYQQTIRAFTALWAPSSDEGDDIAQEVFLAALDNEHTYDPSRDLKTWLLGIARNLTRQAWRRVMRLREVGGSGALDLVLEQQALASFKVRQESADRRRGALDRCIEGLQTKERQLFEGYVVEELSSVALASRFKTTDGTIRMAILRVRRRLRACIELRLQTEAAG